MHTALVAALCLFVLPVAALADGVEDTIAQKNQWAAYGQMLEEKVAAVNAKCGAKLSARFDKASYPTFDAQDRTQAPCRDLLNTLVAVCASPAGKEGVQRVTQVTCRHSAARTGLVRNGGELIVDISPTHTAIVGKQKGSYSWKSAIEELL